MLETAVDSVARQRSSSLSVEYIVVDDGSDPPLSLPDHDWIKLVRLDTNVGNSGARNEGLARATGRWVKYLDSDDILLDGTLEEEVRLGDATGADIVVTSMLEADRVGDEITITKRRPVPTFDPIVDAILDHKTVVNSAALYRGDLARKHRSRRMKLLVDWEYFSRVALHAESVVSLDLDSYVWCHHTEERCQNSWGKTDITAEQPGVIRMMDEVVRERGELTDARREKLARLYYRQLRNAAYAFPDTAAQVARWILALKPDFRPPRSQKSWILFRLFGLERGVRIYGLLARLAARTPLGWPIGRRSRSVPPAS